MTKPYFYCLGVICLLCSAGSALAQAPNSQKARQECCDVLSGDWRLYEDGSKDADGTKRGTCYFKANSTAMLPELAACSAAGGPKKWQNKK